MTAPGVAARRRLARLGAALLLLETASCAWRAATPQAPSRDAALGHAPEAFDPTRACGAWEESVDGDGSATVHDAYAELSPEACLVPVHHGVGLARAEAPPPGCGYPQDRTTTVRALLQRADRYRSIAEGRAALMPQELACALDPADRAAAARQNARALQALARRIEHGASYPYAAVGTFGYGHGAMDDSELCDWRPGQRCPDLSKRQMDLLSIMRVRAGRAAAAQLGGVAPVVLVSGGAVHADLVEAFALYYLLTCRFGVPTDAVLLDPCADHTHTNVRNMGSLVVTLQGRTAYLVTDDGLQSGYLQEWNGFHLIGGSIDQRALRDWGYLLGAWRQASVGLDAGFWFTPYRFWADPRPSIRNLTCVTQLVSRTD